MGECLGGYGVMGVYGGPKIVKSDLVFGVDFASNIVTDASSTVIDPFGNRTLTLNNSPVFINTETNRRRRALNFDGTNSFLSFSEIILSPPWSSIAVFKIVQSTATTTFRSTLFGNTSTSRPGFNVVYNDVDASNNSRVRILTRYFRNDSTYQWFSSYIGPYGSSYVAPALQDAYWVNNIIHLTTTVSASNQYKFYLNGELKQTLTRTTDLDNGFRCNRIGIYGTTSLPMSGNIYRTFVYDKELSASEIQQNFNATRGRFGI
jgi:hypothetical protein